MPCDDPANEVPMEDEATEREIRELARDLETGSRDRPAKSTDTERNPAALRKVLSSPVTALALSVAALALTVLNVLGVPPFGFHAREEADPQEVARRLQATVRFAKEEILFFQEDQGRLPHDLAEAGLEGKADLEYKPSPEGGFRLTAREGDRTLDVIVPAARGDETGDER